MRQIPGEPWAHGDLDRFPVVWCPSGLDVCISTEGYVADVAEEGSPHQPCHGGSIHAEQALCRRRFCWPGR